MSEWLFGSTKAQKKNVKWLENSKDLFSLLIGIAYIDDYFEQLGQLYADKLIDFCLNKHKTKNPYSFASIDSTLSPTIIALLQ